MSNKEYRLNACLFQGNPELRKYKVFNKFYKVYRKSLLVVHTGNSYAL